MSDTDDTTTTTAPKTNGARNGSALVRSAGASMSPGSEMSLGKAMRWLVGHDDKGNVRCDEVKLAFQTSESAAEDKPPSLMDTWTIDPELDEQGRRGEYQKIATAAWEMVNHYMADAKIQHVWKLFRFNAAGTQVGMLWWKMTPELGSNLSEWGADAPTEKGALAAILRAFNTGTAQAMTQQAMLVRTLFELVSMQTETSANALNRYEASIHQREELLDRQAERQVKVELGKVDVARLMQDVQMRGKLYDLAGKGAEALIAKYKPVDAYVYDFIRGISSDKETLVKVMEVLPPEQQQIAIAMIRRMAQQEALDNERKEKSDEKERKEAEARAKENEARAKEEAKAARAAAKRKAPK